MGKLDNIIEYYNSVKNLSLVIQAGYNNLRFIQNKLNIILYVSISPGKDINTYISQLNRLKQAIDYFEANKNQSQKKQNVSQSFALITKIKIFKNVIVDSVRFVGGAMDPRQVECGKRV